MQLNKYNIQAILLDGLELGKFICEGDKLVLKLNSNVKDAWLPPAFSINLDGNMDKVVEEWLTSRIVPKNRIGLTGILKKLGLKKYSIADIFKITHGSALTDPYWISFSAEDTYTKCTKRGNFIEKYPYNSLKIPEEGYTWRV